MLKLTIKDVILNFKDLELKILSTTDESIHNNVRNRYLMFMFSFYFFAIIGLFINFFIFNNYIVLFVSLSLMLLGLSKKLKIYLTRKLIMMTFNSNIKSLENNLYNFVMTLYQVSGPNMTLRDIIESTEKLSNMSPSVKFGLKYINLKIKNGYSVKDSIISFKNEVESRKLRDFFTNLLSYYEYSNHVQYLKLYLDSEKEFMTDKIKTFAENFQSILNILIIMCVIVIILIIVIFSFRQVASSGEGQIGEALEVAKQQGFSIEDMIPEIPLKKIFLIFSFVVFPILSLMLKLSFDGGNPIKSR